MEEVAIVCKKVQVIATFYFIKAYNKIKGDEGGEGDIIS